MNRATLDASVLVAASSPHDMFFRPSRIFLRKLKLARTEIIKPVFARVEVACVLARTLRDAARGREFASALFQRMNVTEVPISEALRALATQRGTEMFLRGADALYVATAELHETVLISWDQEHINRAGAMTPERWLTQNA